MNPKNSYKNKLWQDIKFVKSKKRVASEKVTEGQLIKFATKLLFKKISKRLSSLSRKSLIIISFIIITLIGATLFIVLYLLPNIQSSKINPDESRPVLVKGTPSYPTVTPTDKKISDLGGWTKISPPGSEPVYTFTDKIGETIITISQQPLPEEFKDDTEKRIEELSQSFNASQKITVGTRTIHIGTSSDGPQSVIFSENNILILIKSKSTIKNDEWIKYINNLK